MPRLSSLANRIRRGPANVKPKFWKSEFARGGRQQKGATELVFALCSQLEGLLTRLVPEALAELEVPIIGCKVAGTCSLKAKSWTRASTSRGGGSWAAISGAGTAVSSFNFANLSGGSSRPWGHLIRHWYDSFWNSEKASYRTLRTLIRRSWYNAPSTLNRILPELVAPFHLEECNVMVKPASSRRNTALNANVLYPAVALVNFMKKLYRVQCSALKFCINFRFTFSRCTS